MLLFPAFVSTTIPQSVCPFYLCTRINVQVCPLKYVYRLKHLPLSLLSMAISVPPCPCNMFYCHLFLPATAGGKCHMLSDHGSVMLHSAACSFYDILILSYLLLASVFGLLLIFSFFTCLVTQLLFILLTFFSFLFSFVCCPPSSSSSSASPLPLSLLSVLLSLPVTVVSTLQYKVSSNPTHPDTPPEYRQYRASTLPPSYVRVASSSPPSSASSSPSQEKEAGAARDKAQLSSQLSTSLASAFSPVQAGVTTQGRQVRQIPLSPPTAARHLHLQQQQQQDMMLPPKHGTWSASHLQQMYAQLPPSSSPPVMMAMPVKQGLPPQPVLPVAHPLLPLNTRMKPPPLDPSLVTGPHQYPQHQPHSHSNGQPEDSYSPHSQHLPLTPQYCEAIPLPPLIGQTGPGPTPNHQPQYPSTFHPQQHQQQQQQQVYHQQAQPPTTTTSSSSSPPSYTAMSDGGSPKKSPSPVPQQVPMSSSSKYEEERGGGSISAEGSYMCIMCVYLSVYVRLGTHIVTPEHVSYLHSASTFKAPTPSYSTHTGVFTYVAWIELFSLSCCTHRLRQLLLVYTVSSCSSQKENPKVQSHRVNENNCVGVQNLKI